MNRKTIQLGCFIAALAMSAAAQTNVTNSNNGTSGTVPVYNGAASVTNSPISVSGSNVGIGTTTPDAQISLGNGITTIKFAAFDGGADNLYGMGVNGGELTFGAAISASGTPQLVLTSNGNVGIGTTSPGQTFQVNGTTLFNGGTGANTFNDVSIGGVGGWSPNEAHRLNFMLGAPASQAIFSTIESSFDGTSARLNFRNLYSSGLHTGIAMTILGNSSGLGNVGIGTTTPEDTLTVDGDILTSGVNGSGNGPFAASLYAGSSSDGIFLGHNGVAHAGIKWSGESLDFLNASPWGADSDAWTGYVPLFTMNFASGNVGIGTTSPLYTLDVTGQIRATSGVVLSSGAITFPDGSQFTTASCSGGGDYAESVDVTGQRKTYDPGDVLVLDSENPGKVLKSVRAYSTAVAGIYSTRPGTVGRRQLTPKSDSEVPMALVGVVPTKVSAENGAIRIGDLLVSSATPGYAMKGTDRNQMLGAVIGKAMGPLDSGTGVIEVLVILQ